LRSGDHPLEDFAAYRVAREKGASVIAPIEIDPDGCDVYENWEKGISQKW